MKVNIQYMHLYLGYVIIMYAHAHTRAHIHTCVCMYVCTYTHFLIYHKLLQTFIFLLLINYWAFFSPACYQPRVVNRAACRKCNKLPSATDQEYDIL